MRESLKGRCRERVSRLLIRMDYPTAVEVVAAEFKVRGGSRGAEDDVKVRGGEDLYRVNQSTLGGNWACRSCNTDRQLSQTSGKGRLYALGKAVTPNRTRAWRVAGRARVGAIGEKIR